MVDRAAAHHALALRQWGILRPSWFFNDSRCCVFGEASSSPHANHGARSGISFGRGVSPLRRAQVADRCPGHGRVASGFVFGSALHVELVRLQTGCGQAAVPCLSLLSGKVRELEVDHYAPLLAAALSGPHEQGGPGVGTQYPSPADSPADAPTVDHASEEDNRYWANYEWPLPHVLLSLGKDLMPGISMMSAQHNMPFLAEDVRRSRRRTCLLLHPDKAASGASDAERRMLLDRMQAVNRTQSSYHSLMLLRAWAQTRAEARAKAAAAAASALALPSA